jgi:hypothetical protein
MFFSQAAQQLLRHFHWHRTVNGEFPCFITRSINVLEGFKVENKY